MGISYYDILKVSSKANEEELRKSYKKLAMVWHPDKHPNTTKKIAETKFKQICEAYDVLSDTQKRQIYDLYGEDGLKYNVSSPSCEKKPNRSTSFQCNYKSRVSDQFFDDFFDGISDVDVDNNNNKNGGKIKSMKSDICNYKNLKSNESNKMFNRSVSSMGKKVAPLENKLVCSLEELYKGSKRKMKIERVVSDDFGKPMNVEEVLSIDIKPGWKKGTKITFPDKGNQEPGHLPGDLIFIVSEKPHSTFKRDGNDLLVNIKLTLLEALTGKVINLKTLDERNLKIEVSEIVKPGHELVISGEGMPLSKDPKKRGNLRIKFDIKFPSRLSSNQKADLSRVLGRSDS